MGVKTSLAAITPSANGKAAVTAAGSNYTDLLAEAQLKCQEAIVILNYLVNDPLNGVSSESSNITAINAQITALS
jgi:hypothetical protein